MSAYKVFVAPLAWKEVKDLPGNIRQRVRKAINGLAEEPRPSKSKHLTVPEITSEIRRLRLDLWRIVYAVSEVERVVDILTVRKRPPYDYGDLESLLKDLK